MIPVKVSVKSANMMSGGISNQ